MTTTTTDNTIDQIPGTTRVQARDAKTPRILKVQVTMTIDLDLDSWDLNYGGWDQSRQDIRGQVREDARSAVEIDLDARGIKATVR